MIRRFDLRERRILSFPSAPPCESASPETLLQSLITSSENIRRRFQNKSFATQRRNAREIIRQVSILSVFFEEIRSSPPDSSLALCLSELHVALQKIELLLEDCAAREGSKFFVLMKSGEASAQFRALTRSLATSLDVLPVKSVDGASLETTELVEMVAKQARRAKMEVEERDDEAMKRVLLVLNQFENRFEPDPFLTRKIITHMGIGSWAECHKEIKFLEDEIRREYSEGNEREIHLLSGLMGFLCYCRGMLFDDCDFSVLNQYPDSRSSSNAEVLSCLNPRDFRCPISLELMTDPVTVSTGQTYDRASIQRWLKSGSFTCPKTGEVLTSTELVPNTNLKMVIHRFCAEYGVSLAKTRTKNRDISRTILPGSKAYAEAMKFLSVFLVLNLSYGSENQKKKAAFEIRILAKSNLFNRARLIEAGAVPPLLELLDSREDELLQENAVSGLLKLSKQLRGQNEIMEKNGLNRILNVLKNGAKIESKQIAAATIFYLSSAHEHRKSIGENPETIPSLLELIERGTPCGKKNSVAALFAVLVDRKNRGRAVEAGAVPVLLNLLEASEKPELKVDAMAVISTLAESFEGCLEILRKSSGLPLLMGSLRAIESRAGKEYCVSTLHSLCLNCGADAVSVLAEDSSLMSELYKLLTEGTVNAVRKARSVIKILQGWCESRPSDSVRGIGRERFVNVR